jgi:hypothetical protein
MPASSSAVPEIGATRIRILEPENNRRGDLFAQLMADLFVALGYEQPRLNVHKSGHELDLEAHHRLEPRRAIAECKATASAIGGDDLNKFIGALDVEGGNGRPITGYFVSLAGFRETAIEQERQRPKKIILLDGTQVVEEMVRGRILIARDRATELAGRLCASFGYLTLDPEVELLAHERGWIWAAYYMQGKARTHFALIHSDGTVLAQSVADEVIGSDRDCGGVLQKLACLNPAPILADAEDCVEEAVKAYRRYLENECGYIHLDGLPADSDVGSRRLRLENLFVPLRLESTKKKRETFGSVLAGHPRLAILAAPGSGKSTLIKRLAIAYSDPARRDQIADDLPNRHWLPLFFRCRELRGLARGSFAELIQALSQREPVREYAIVFCAYVDRVLLKGGVLLLVDGLDEISDAGDRAAFVCMLRSTLQAYPSIAIVVTSREAGYRHVTLHMASICTKVTLSPFDDEDIKRLTIAWHREVVGDTEKVRTDAEQLAEAIVRNDRIKRLAVNPLLLTTLLLVKRWVGLLPTRRAVLYGKAVEVLLMTWNTEGHEPIPEEEALPQLCYVASAMMLNGMQKASRPRLASWLKEAREAMPVELGYVRGTAEEFMHRVEHRSSLLMMSGYDVEDSRLVEFFEFRHLTFQEFLTARAMVEGWHPGRKGDDTLASVLQPHFSDDEWREVIPLAAVLGGKAAESLIQSLMDNLQSEGSNSACALLINSLSDEAPARPDAVRAALREIVRFPHGIPPGVSTTRLARSRYGSDLRDESGKAVLIPGALVESAASWLTTAVWSQTPDADDSSAYKSLAQRFIEMMNSPKQLTRVEGALGAMNLCSLLRHGPTNTPLAESLCKIGFASVPLLFAEALAERYAASYALARLGECGVWLPPGDPDVLSRLWLLWRRSSDPQVSRKALLALSALPLAPRDEGNRFASVGVSEVRGIVQFAKDDEVHLVGLIASWYLRAFPDDDIANDIEYLSNQRVLFASRLLDRVRNSRKADRAEKPQYL